MMSRFIIPAMEMKRSSFEAHGSCVGNERKSSVNRAENIVARVINIGEANWLNSGEFGQIIWKPIPVNVRSIMAMDRILRM